MSLRYKLFGIPKTVDEFADKAKRQSRTSVDIVVSESFQPSAYSMTYTYSVLGVYMPIPDGTAASSQKTKSYTYWDINVLLDRHPIEESIELFSGPDPEHALKKAQAVKLANEKASAFATELKEKHGLEATIQTFQL